jgi:hypothetical protein
MCLRSQFFFSQIHHLAELKECSYAEFVVVSKEVSTLENEMLEFKEALSEWKGMPSLLHIDDSASVAGA